MHVSSPRGPLSMPRPLMRGALPPPPPPPPCPGRPARDACRCHAPPLRLRRAPGWHGGSGSRGRAEGLGPVRNVRLACRVRGEGGGTETTAATSRLPSRSARRRRARAGGGGGRLDTSQSMSGRMYPDLRQAPARLHFGPERPAIRTRPVIQSAAPARRRRAGRLRPPTVHGRRKCGRFRAASRSGGRGLWLALMRPALGRAAGRRRAAVGHVSRRRRVCL